MDLTEMQTLNVISKAGNFNKWIYQVIKPFLKGHILEIGSGIGNISELIVNSGNNITLSDLKTEYCEHLSKKFSGYSNVKEIISLDLEHPHFETAYPGLKENFDTVFLSNVIEHLKNDVTAINNCKYLLKKKGHLIILAPAFQCLFCRLDEELGHFRRYTLKQLQVLYTRQKIEIIYKQYFNLLGIAGWFLFGKCFKKKLIGSSEMKIYDSLVPIFKFADKLVLKQAGLSAIMVGKKNH